MSEGAPDAIATIADAAAFVFVGSLERPGASAMVICAPPAPFLE